MNGPTGDLDRDTQFLQRVFDCGGRVPPGEWMFRGPLLYPLHPVRVELEGAVLNYVTPRDDWQSGFAICSRGYRLPGRPRARGLRLDFGRTGRLVLPEQGWTGARKGIGVTDTDDAQVLGARVLGPRRRQLPDNRLFSFQIHNSSDVLVRGGYLSIQNGVQGADGIHLTGTCRRVRVEELETLSGDDGAALTHEGASRDGDVMEDITFVRCRINNVGHSAIKGLILADKPNCVIRRWMLRDCDMVTQTAQPGAGAPARMWADAGLIEDITIEGGRLIAVIPPDGRIHEPVVSLRRVRRFVLRGTAIEHYTRSILKASDSPDLEFAPASVTLSPPFMAVPRNADALVDLVRCPGAQVRLPARLTPGWPGQVRIRTDGRDG